MLGEGERGLDERQVRERLRKVAELHPGPRIVFFAQEAEIVTQSEQAIEQRLRFVQPALHSEDFDQPERASQEDAFARWEPIDMLLILASVAKQETVDTELASDRFDGRDESRIVRRQEADDRHEQNAGVELVRSVRLGEGLLAFTPTAPEHLILDLVAELPPAIHAAVASELFVDADGAIEGYPGHHLRVGEVP